jgi:hypothetical protein
LSITAQAGGLVKVTVMTLGEDVRVEVTDCGGDGVPVLGPASCEAEGSRGLRLVEALTRRWGYERGNGLAVTWFELGQR